MQQLWRKMASSSSPKRFAALSKSNPSQGRPPLRGVVFDMDGTLCLPQNYMFADMRKVLNISKSTDILEHIYTLPPAEQSAAQSTIRSIEQEAMRKQTPQPGLGELMSYLDSHKIPKAICTRNFDEPLEHLLSKFLSNTTFQPLITRAFHPPKPHPAGILHIAEFWGLRSADGTPNAGGVIMVGDSIDDMVAGRAAGATTVLLLSEANQALATHVATDLTIHRLDDLVGILEHGFEGRVIEADQSLP